MRKAFPILLALALVTLVAAACSGSPTTAPAPTAAAAPTPGTAQPYPVATKPATPAANGGAYPVAPDGKALVSQRCVICHDVSRIEASKKTQADWQSTVNRMKGKGAALNDVETLAVLAYLAATFK